MSEEELDAYFSWEISNTNFFIELTPALKAIDEKLREYKSKFKGAALVVLQSEITAARL